MSGSSIAPPAFGSSLQSSPPQTSVGEWPSPSASRLPPPPHSPATATPPPQVVLTVHGSPSSHAPALSGVPSQMPEVQVSLPVQSSSSSQSASLIGMASQLLLSSSQTPA